MSVESTQLFLAGAKRDLARRMFAGAQALANAIRARFEGPRSGRLYRRRGNAEYAKESNGRRTKRANKRADMHQASADGESPAKDTGFLNASVTAIQTDVSGLRYRVGVSAPGALALETTLNRPYMKPALDSWRTTAGRRFKTTASP